MNSTLIHGPWAAPAAPYDDWISTENLLPIPGVKCITITALWNGYQHLGFGQIQKWGWVVSDLGLIEFKTKEPMVTYWLPLPPVPKPIRVDSSLMIGPDARRYHDMLTGPPGAVHFSLNNSNLGVRPICTGISVPIRMERHLWTNSPNETTCPECLKEIRQWDFENWIFVDAPDVSQELSGGRNAMRAMPDNVEAAIDTIRGYFETVKERATGMREAEG